MKFKNLIHIGIILSVLFSACNKEEIPTYEIKDANIFDVKSETDWDYWIVGKNDDYLFVKENNGVPERIYLCVNKSNDGYSIYMDDAGRPQKAVIEDHIFLFSNFSESKMDMAAILPSGELKIERTINTGQNWNLYADQSSVDREELFKWAGNIAGGIATSIKSFETKQTGLEFPFAKLNSENTMLNALGRINKANYELLDLSQANTKTISSLLACDKNDALSTSLEIASKASSITSASLAKFMNNEQKSLAMQILSITLTTGSAGKVTNNSAECSIKAVFNKNYPEANKTYEFNIGISYCQEEEDPTISGTRRIKKITYGPNSESSFDFSFGLNELHSDKRYKYCVFIQHDDFIEYGYVNTFGTVFISVESWEQTGSEHGSFTHNEKSFEYEFYLDEICLLTGDTAYIAECGVYTGIGNRYNPANGIILGEIFWKWTIWSNNSSVTDTHTPYVKFKNGEYFMGNPVNISASHGENKSGTLSLYNTNTLNSENACTPYNYYPPK